MFKLKLETKRFDLNIENGELACNIYLRHRNIYFTIEKKMLGLGALFG